MNPIDDCFLSRAEVMRRWRISIATIKRRERQGILRPIRMSAHVIRYRLSDDSQSDTDSEIAAKERKERKEKGVTGVRNALNSRWEPSLPIWVSTRISRHVSAAAAAVTLQLVTF